MATNRLKDGWEKKLGPALGFDPNFGGLDVSGCPSLQALPSESDWIDERFAGMDGSAKGNGSAELKEFIAGHTAQETTSTVHVGKHEFRVFFSDGVWNADGSVDGKRHRCAANSRDELLSKLMPIVKSTATRRDTFRELTEAEELHIARLAQSGDESSAFGQYFLSRIGPHVAEMEDPYEVINSPKYRSICDEAAYFIWAARTDSYIPDPDFEARLARVAESKPLSGKLITHVWIQYLDEQQGRDRQALFNRLSSPEQETQALDPRDVQESLEDASDETIQKLYKGTVREIADSYRRRR